MIARHYPELLAQLDALDPADAADVREYLAGRLMPPAPEPPTPAEVAAEFARLDTPDPFIGARP